MKRTIFTILILFATTSAFSDEIKMEYWGTAYLTKMIDTNVNVRDFPTLNGNKMDKYYLNEEIRVTGISMVMDTIDNHTGYWLRVNKIEDENDKLYPKYEGYGWIWSKYVDGLSDLVPSEISFKEFLPETDRTVASIIINVTHDDSVREVQIFPHKEPNQDYFTFVWSDDMEDFIYYDVPGTYIWHPENNKIEHVTYLGTDMESAWCIFTDDKDYMLQDHGTSPGIRSVSVIELSTGNRIYSGDYIRPLNLNGYNIDISYEASSWNIREGSLDVETIEHFEEYKAENNPPEENSGYEVVVKYQYNFITKERKFIECYYRYFQ